MRELAAAIVTLMAAAIAAFFVFGQALGSRLAGMGRGASNAVCSSYNAHTSFVVGLAAGTCCTVVSKALFQAVSRGRTGEFEVFAHPFFQTWLTFVAIACAVPAFFLWEHLQFFRVTHTYPEPSCTRSMRQLASLPARAYAALLLVSSLDVFATVLLLLGLQLSKASIWSLLRLSGTVCVSLTAHLALQHDLTGAMRIGLVLITLGLALGVLSTQVAVGGETAWRFALRPADLIGAALTLAGTCVQSFEYTIKLLPLAPEARAVCTAVHPYLSLGVLGVAGFCICSFVLYPLAYLLPGADHGSLEDPLNALLLLSHSGYAFRLAVTYAALVFAIGILSVRLPHVISPVGHAILADLRPISIWITEVYIFYSSPTASFGEVWRTSSWLQVVGMGLALLGAAVHSGVLQLPPWRGDAAVTPPRFVTIFVTLGPTIGSPFRWTFQDSPPRSAPVPAAGTGEEPASDINPMEQRAGGLGQSLLGE